MILTPFSHHFALTLLDIPILNLFLLVTHILNLLNYFKFPKISILPTRYIYDGPFLDLYAKKLMD